MSDLENDSHSGQIEALVKDALENREESELIQACIKNNDDANVYSVQNSFLTQDQKVYVDCWDGIAHSLLSLTILTGAIAFPSHSAFEIIVVGLCVGLFSSSFLLSNPKNPIVVPLGALICGWVGAFLKIALAGYLVYLGRWGYGVYGFLAAFSLDFFLDPSTLIYVIFGGKVEGKRMHYKYAIAKRVFGVTYPFERWY